MWALWAWFSDPARWQGSDAIPVRIAEHLAVSGAALAIAAVVALPIGIGLGHFGRGGFLAMNLANIGRALPSMALLAFALPLAFALNLGLGFWPTFLALVPLGLPPILTNAYVSIREVDRDVVDSARGMGHNRWQTLLRVELPLALPLMIGGVRNAAVAIVATAPLGALVAGGGLGRYIIDGLQRQEGARLFAGALLVALMAIATEVGFSVLERALISPGLRGGSADGTE